MGSERWQRTVLGELVAEAFGTFLLIAFGCGSVAMSVAALNQSDRGKLPFEASGDWLLICFGWGFAVTFAIYATGGVTGAHLNPAITLAMALRRGFAWSKVPSYWAAQLIGAFAGAALIFLLYHDAISSYEGANHIARGSPDGAATFGIFGTVPAPYFENAWIPLLDQVVGTAFLVAFVLAVRDEYNAPVKANLAPLIVGFIVLAIGISFGANAGYAINPARDLGPRLLAGIAGWGGSAVPGDYGAVNGYMWVPIVGPLLGAVVGAFAYDGLVRQVLVNRGVEPDQEVVEQGQDVID
ncbi:MAG: glycerol uptake facilitator protein [Solirubrobacteraceae bacterium]|nr:glycerol uptake facilitator protein [Solirubrobacteraceae bacterium]